MSIYQNKPKSSASLLLKKTNKKQFKFREICKQYSTKIYINVKKKRIHGQDADSLLKSRKVAIDRTATEVKDKRQMFTDVFHWPFTEEAVQQALVSS